MPNTESQTIEYKQELSASFESEVVAFLNSKTGGHLYIGIADKNVMFIKVATYGGLVEGLSKDDFFSCCSMPRNRELMRVFHDLELVEQLGSGMTRIMRVYKSDIFTFTSNFMKTTFPFGGEQKLGDELGDKLGDKLGDEDSLSVSRKNLSEVRCRILELMEEDSRISLTAIAQRLGYSTTAIEKNVDFLKANGYLKRVGNTKSGYWEVLE